MEGEPEPLPGERDGFKQSAILADPRHRRILSILQTRSKPTTVEELCRRLAGADRDGPATVSESAIGEIRIDLRHRCLPKLEALGWIERRPDGLHLNEGRLVETGDISLPELGAPDDPAWEVVSALLARPYRRTILLAVDEHGGPLTAGALADELRTKGGTSWAAQSGGDRTLSLALHHVDLPKLAAIGVIEYDRDGRTVGSTRRLSACIARLNLDTG